MDKKEISLVIGSVYDDLDELVILFNHLDNNIDHLGEIICVVSGVNNIEKKQDLSILKSLLNIKIEIISLDRIVMPGEARNIGIIESKCEYICFLDSHPLPNKDWLFNSKKILKEKNLRGVFGRCKYIGINEIETCFIAATFGSEPLYTVPGTLIEKKLLTEIGFFIPYTRSGEDAEWRSRAKLFHPRINQTKVSPLIYKGLKGKNFLDLINKWYLYYQSTYLTSSFVSQRILYISYLVIFSIFLAFSWNDQVADWDENSILYAPHISKILCSLIIFIYLFYRLFLLPINKKVNIFKFNIIQFLKFSFISVILDLVKVIAFINHKKAK